MAQNVTQYCHVCKSQRTSGPPVVTRDVEASLEKRFGVNLIPSQSFRACIKKKKKKNIYIYIYISVKES